MQYFQRIRQHFKMNTKYLICFSPGAVKLCETVLGPTHFWKYNRTSDICFFGMASWSGWELFSAPSYDEISKDCILFKKENTVSNVGYYKRQVETKVCEEMWNWDELLQINISLRRKKKKKKDIYFIYIQTSKYCFCSSLNSIQNQQPLQ